MRSREHPDDLVELGVDVLRVGLGEDRSDDRRDHGTCRLRDVGEHVAHEVNPTTLPRRALEHGLDRCNQSRVSVGDHQRSEEHTSELQSLMRISYAVFRLKKKKTKYSNNKL